MTSFHIRAQDWCYREMEWSSVLAEWAGLQLYLSDTWPLKGWMWQTQAPCGIWTGCLLPPTPTFRLRYERSSSSSYFIYRWGNWGLEEFSDLSCSLQRAKPGPQFGLAIVCDEGHKELLPWAFSHCPVYRFWLTLLLGKCLWFMDSWTLLVWSQGKSSYCFLTTSLGI